MGKTGADDHRLMLLRGGVWVDITEQVGDMQTSDEMNTLSVELTFRLLENPLDRYVPQRRLRVGDKLRIINAADGGAEVFSGMVTADSLEFQYTAHDSGWHLGKSELVFQVSAAAADVALRQLCARAGVPVGNIPAMSTRITAVYVGESFAGILEDILERVTTETGRRFLYRVEGGKFWLRDLPDEVITVQHRPADNVAPFDPTWALGEPSGGHDLGQDFANAVVLVKEDNDIAYVLARAENAASIQLYGRVQKTISVSGDLSGSPAQIVKSALEESDRLGGEFTISQMYGDDRVKSGRVIQFSSAAFGLSGAMRCVSVTHLYGHPHLMQLTVTPVKPERATATADTVTGSTAPLVTSGGGNGSRSAFVAVAKGEIGTTEQPIGSNQTKYGAWFGADGSPWCAIFVSWCAAQADIAEETMPRSFAAVGEFQEWFRQRGLFRAKSAGYVPQPGDLMIQKSAGASHIGIVEKADENGFKTIEGNSSNKVRRVSYSYSDAKLTGFCTPKW